MSAPYVLTARYRGAKHTYHLSQEPQKNKALGAFAVAVREAQELEQVGELPRPVEITLARGGEVVCRRRVGK